MTSRHQPRLCLPRFRPELLSLEDRTAPATFPVTTLSDAGPGSLRAAIAAANDEIANLGQDEIVFAAVVRGGAVNLTTFENPPASTPAVPQPAGPSAFPLFP